MNATAKAFYQLGVKFQKVIINSSYRSHGWQAEYLVNNSDKWSKYSGTEPLLLFCRDIVDGTLTQEHIKNVRDKSVEDAPLFNSLPSSEQQAFPPHFNSGRSHFLLKGNKEEAKIILEKWIEVSNVLSNHTKRKAVDFSKRNNSQHGDFKKILEDTYGLTAKDPYSSGNFHMAVF